MWNSIVSVPDHCLFIYFTSIAGGISRSIIDVDTSDIGGISPWRHIVNRGTSNVGVSLGTLLTGGRAMLGASLCTLLTGVRAM